MSLFRLDKSQVAALVQGTAWRGGRLGQAAAFHLEGVGRAWRSRRGLDCAAYLDMPLQQAAAPAAACKMVHQASVVHDDVQDEALVHWVSRARIQAPACLAC